MRIVHETHGSGEENWVGTLSNLCLRQHGWSLPKFEFVLASEPDKVQCVCALDTESKHLTVSGAGPSKADAKQEAARQMVELLQKEHRKHELDGKALEVQLIKDGYVRQLGDLQRDHTGWFVSYHGESGGPAHHPVYTFICTLKTDQGFFQCEGKASRRRLAKQLAARKMLQQIRSGVLSDRPTARGLTTPQSGTRRDYAHRLSMLCLGQGWKGPYYAFHQDQADPSSFVGQCTIQTLRGNEEACGKGSSRSEAKQESAKAMLSSLAQSMIEKDSAVNAVGDLLRICTDNNWSQPSFSFEQWGDSHKSISTCHATLLMANGPLEAAGVGTTGEQAHRNAALELLGQLRLNTLLKHGIYVSQTVGYIKSLLSEESAATEAATGHDWWHVHRVWQNAKHIAKEEGADLFAVELAAILHDIADWKFHDGDDAAGPREARAWLEKIGVDEGVIDRVCTIINEVSFKGAGVPTSPTTLDGKVVQDADRLDAIGAIGIARAFAYGGHKGREIHNPGITPEMHQTFEQYKCATGTTLNHFYEKLLLLKERMNTRTAREMAERRHVFMEEFLKQFHEEVGTNSK